MVGSQSAVTNLGASPGAGEDNQAEIKREATKDDRESTRKV